MHKKTLLYVNSCNSTNDLMYEQLKNKQKIKNFFCIYTFNQKKGRGQRSNIWICEANKNLAMTFFIKKHKSFDDLFYSFFIIIHLRRFLQKIIPHIIFFIKWSNDIIINNKKISGILIEKKQNNLIIGIGINCNQNNFKHIPNATSLKEILSLKINLHEIAKKIIFFFYNEYKKIKFIEYKNYFNNLIKEYNKYLFRINQLTFFKKNNIYFFSEIIKVDKKGKLYIKFNNGKIKSFNNKEISIIQ